MGASAEPAWLFAACASPSGASSGPGAARPESLSRKGLQTKKKSLPPHSLKMFQRICLRFVFGLNLSPGPMSQLGGSKPCRASETGAVRPSAKPAVLW